MERRRSAQASSNCAPSSKSSSAVTPGAVAEAEPGTMMNVAKLTSRSARTCGSTPSAGAPSVSKTEYALPPCSVRYVRQKAMFTAASASRCVREARMPGASLCATKSVA